MICDNCGNKLREGATFCNKCGTHVMAEDTNESANQEKTYVTQTKPKQKTVIIIIAVLAALAVITAGVILAINLFHNNNGSPDSKVIVVESTTDNTESSIVITEYVTEIPTTRRTEPPTEKPTDPPTEAPYSISQSDLEKEIERIRTYYYTPGDDDDQVVLDNGTDGWNYSRDYRYHNGKLVFAFIFDGTEEHRLYFKDDHMIRYIDENHVTYDYPDLSDFSEWEEKALAEAYKVFSDTAAQQINTSGWSGTWENDSGETIEITSVTDSGISLIYNHLNEKGDRWLHSTMEMKYTDSSHSKITENNDLGTWKYSMTLYDEYILVESRYPDMMFYKKP